MSKMLKVFQVETNADVNVIKAVCRIKNKIVVGTKVNDVYEIQEKTGSVNCMVVGHSEGELWGLAVHPNKQIFVTASYDSKLRSLLYYKNCIFIRFLFKIISNFGTLKQRYVLFTLILKIILF